MKWLNKIFGNTLNKAPKSWLGRWEDKNGKQLIIEPVNEKEGAYKVSCLDKFNQPYTIKGLSEEWKSLNLITTFAHDIHDEIALSVEAGEDGVGTTYELKFGIEKDEYYRLANKSDELSNVLIIPNLGVGLYGDDEDDLGAPWAIPLEAFKKVEDFKDEEILIIRNEYIKKGKELMTSLGEKYGLDFTSEDDFGKLFQRSNGVPQNGELNKNWNFAFHGPHCGFYKRGSDMSIEMEADNYENLESWFMLTYLKDHPKYMYLTNRLEWEDLQVYFN